VVFALVIVPRQIQQLRPYAPPKLKPYEVIYFSGDELPRTEDLGGSPSGAKGRAGGHEAYHHTQTIHVARGGSLAPRIVDAPDLKMPATTDAVANLLALKSAPAQAIAATPSAEDLHSSLRAHSLLGDVIAPAPSVALNGSRSGISLNAVVPPSATITSRDARTVPSLSTAIIPPSPSVRSEHTLYMPALDPTVIAPSPSAAMDHTRAAPSLNANVIAPSPAPVKSDRAISAVQPNVVPPAPSGVGREVAPSRVRIADPSVVPPPVSAPERDSRSTAKLSLPAPAVIAPPPSPDSTRDLRRLESGAAATAPSTVVPPPPSGAGNTSFLSSVIGRIFGTQDVVPPPPAVSSQVVAADSRGSGTLATNVIPPPPGAGPASARSSGNTRRGSLSTNVVPPPPSAVTANDKAVGDPRTSPLQGNVVPPPPSVSTADTRSLPDTRSSGSLLAGNVVPPPPKVAASGTSSTRRNGLADLGSAVAPPKPSTAGGENSGVVVSSDPGSKVALPGNSGKGSLALSPSGGEKSGIGGSGGGEGLGRGEGVGSGLSGAASGAGKAGTNHGSEGVAHAGISPTPGSGGAGGAATGIPAVPGVDVRGGSTSIVTLPSFGSDGSARSNAPGRSSVKQQQGPAIQIVATSRSGGAFDFYGKLPGDNYTIYLDTSIGTVVMQFAEANPTAHSQAAPLIGPQGMRTDLPMGLPHARVVVKCRVDASGNLGNFQVLEPGPANMTGKVMAALRNWKFRPASRGTQPVEVNAILGFNIDTNDRY
jgi:TonB family protein